MLYAESTKTTNINNPKKCRILKQTNQIPQTTYLNQNNRLIGKMT